MHKNEIKPEDIEEMFKEKDTYLITWQLALAGFLVVGSVLYLAGWKLFDILSEGF